VHVLVIPDLHSSNVVHMEILVIPKCLQSDAFEDVDLFLVDRIGLRKVNLVRFELNAGESSVDDAWGDRRKG
jgi:hypothetical protein